MCEMPSAFKSETRTAAKQHKCCECYKPINKGDQYRYSSGIWDGTASSFKQCLNCHEIMEAAAKSAEFADEAPAFRGLRDWFDDYKCNGFDGDEWISGMAEQIGIERDKLALLLSV